MKYRQILFLISFVFLTGCICPIPNSRLESYGIEGKLVDYKTKKPITNAVIIGYALDPVYYDKEYTETDENGVFKLEPFYKWHYGYFISPISYPIWPFTGDIFPIEKRIKVIAPNYPEYSLKFIPGLTFQLESEGAEKVIRTYLMNDERFIVPKIYLKKGI